MVIDLNGARPETTIAVDAMGGDFAPVEVVSGAIAAHRRGVRVVLVGRTEEVRPLVETQGADIPIVHAPDVIDMHEVVTPGLRHRKSSLQVCAELVLSDDADAVVSCGNSAAIYFVALHSWGTQAGIDRPAFGATIPARDGTVFLLDVGANSAVKASNLVQFAVMGDVFLRVQGIEAPRVALLSNGVEDSKGTREIRDANQELRGVDMNFIGNVEGDRIFDGHVDVVVTDGFSGNILLKGGEGVANQIFDLLRTELKKDFLSRLAAATLRPAFGRVKRRLDYEEYGGVPVLGVNGVMINCHGRSKAKAVANAISLADRVARQHIVERIGEALHVDGAESAGRRRRLARALHLGHE